MSHAVRATLTLGIAASALMATLEIRLYAQAANSNAAPNPYKMEENWAQLPAGQKFGSTIKVQLDHSDGKSIWVFDRCGATECTNSTIAPIEKFSPLGAFQQGIGGGMFAVPHGFYVDHDGNVWGGDQIARNGKGADLIKFSPDGKVLMILGKPGMPGNGPEYLTTGSAVVVTPTGEIYVADGHGAGTNDRIVKFSRMGNSSRHGASTARLQANSTRRMASPSIRRDGSMSPTALTTASRFLSLTANSSPNGSSSVGRAMSPSTRTTWSMWPTRNRIRPTIRASSRASGLAASRTARSPLSFRSPRPRSEGRKASGWTMRAMSMPAGLPRWPCGGT